MFAGKRERFVSLVVSLSSAAILPTSSAFAGGHEHGPIYRTLDALAGGIEKVIDVAAAAKQRSCLSEKKPLCDDACDAMTMGEFAEYPSSLDPLSSGMEFSPMPSHLSSPLELAPQLAPHPGSTAQPGRTTAPAPRIPTPPGDTPRVARPMPAQQPVPRSVDDEWSESFSAQPPAQATPTVPRRPLETAPSSKPGAGTRRSPAETYDSLPNPFLDDPQSRHAPRSANQPASYWEPW